MQIPNRGVLNILSRKEYNVSNSRPHVTHARVRVRKYSSLIKSWSQIIDPMTKNNLDDVD
jgi:hypothetical protein